MSYKALTSDNCKFKNFKYREFKCKCGGKYCNGYPVAFSYELANNLQKVRDYFCKPLVITSALRCETWNSKQGGIIGSKHKKGWACDFYISGVSYTKLANYVKKLPYFNYCYRINKNQNVIHYDILPPEEVKYNLTRLLKKGSKGSDVKELQKCLNISTDGIFGDNTKKAVKTFQKGNKLWADGVVGKNTAHALGWTYQNK